MVFSLKLVYLILVFWLHFLMYFLLHKFKSQWWLWFSVEHLHHRLKSPLGLVLKADGSQVSLPCQLGPSAWECSFTMNNCHIPPGVCSSCQSH